MNCYRCKNTGFETISLQPGTQQWQQSGMLPQPQLAGHIVTREIPCTECYQRRLQHMNNVEQSLSNQYAQLTNILTVLIEVKEVLKKIEDKAEIPL